MADDLEALAAYAHSQGTQAPEIGEPGSPRDAMVRLEAMRLAVAGLGPGAPIRLLLLGAEQIEQYVRFGNLPPAIPPDGGEKS